MKMTSPTATLLAHVLTLWRMVPNCALWGGA